MIVLLIWMACYERLHRITHIMVHTSIFKYQPAGIFTDTLLCFSPFWLSGTDPKCSGLTKYKVFLKSKRTLASLVFELEAYNLGA